MKLLFVADGRSPIALNWIAYFTGGEHEVHLVSMFSSQADLKLASQTVLPVAFTRATEAGGEPGKGSILRRIAPPNLRTRLRQYFVPRSLPPAARQLEVLINELQPDLVHAMRIPYEGMLAAQAVPAHIPLLVSIWGNDFTLHAASGRQMAALTRQVLERADALHTDCWRDNRLAGSWGFDLQKPSIVLPGAGGIQLDVFYPSPMANLTHRLSPVVINPRGLRAYVRTDTFFQAIPKVLAQSPDVKFVCPVMAGEAQAEKWVERLKLHRSVFLLPRLSRIQMADAFRRAQVVLSITTHDGTPNTLLEAMACGCFPIAGDLESLREWITPGVNGLLVNPSDADELAVAILRALADGKMRDQAQAKNLELIHERAEYNQVMQKAALFYQQIVALKPRLSQP
jgi:glycosyltransferase involved in cell wall biosynthesis